MFSLFASLNSLTAQPTSGMVAYYPCNGNADDASGQGNHGVAYSTTAVPDRFGNPDSAIGFDGSNTLIRIPASASLTLNESLTISAWVRWQTNAYGSGMIAWHGDSRVACDPYVLNIVNNKAQFRSDVADGQTVLAADSGVAVASDEWTFIVGVKQVSADGVILRVFLNGELSGSTNCSRNIEYDTSGMTTAIGAVDWGLGASHFFSGAIDEVRIYNRALSSAEIKGLYDDLTGLVAYYPCNANAQDASGLGNHGVVYGAVPVPDRFGNPNSAYAFDGSNALIRIPASTSLTLNRSLTVSAWVRWQTNRYGTGMVTWHGDSRDALDPYVLNIVNNQAQFRSDVADGWTVLTANSATTVSPAAWSFLTGVKQVSADGVTLRVYLNGELAGSTNSAKNIEYDTSGMVTAIGAVDWGGSASHYFSGDIDEVRLYNRALNTAEINALYNEARLNIAVSQIRLCWNTISNKTYQVQYRTSALAPDVWVNLGTPVPGTGSTQCATDEVSSPQRFYRVIPTGP